MTDRVSGFIVVLDATLRTDDAESTIAAIRHIKGVVSVAPVIADLQYHTARQQVKAELTAKLFDALKET